MISSDFLFNYFFLHWKQQKLHDAVAMGNIRKVEDLLDMPKMDINMTWYSENLLMTAIRNKQETMAEYLINRGIDVTYQAQFMVS